MSDGTHIQWADATWPITAGCEEVSDGCTICYAARLTSGRLRHLPEYAGLAVGGKFTGSARPLPDRLDWPYKWRKPRRVFIASMSDIFHDDIPDGFIVRVLRTVYENPQHTFILLTKRHARMRSFFTRWADRMEDGSPQLLKSPAEVGATHTSGRGQLFADMLDDQGPPPEGYGYPFYDWQEGMRWWPAMPANMWVGVSVENQQWADIRIPALLETPAAVRWISAEPLLGPVDLDRWLYLSGASTAGPWTDGLGRRRRTDGRGRSLGGGAGGMTISHIPSHDLGWVVVGGESGPGSRPMQTEWAQILRDQCLAAEVPFFFKQWGDWCHQDQLPPDVWSDIDAAINLGQQPHPQPLRVGKKRAGRELDGVEWNQYPEVVTR